LYCADQSYAQAQEISDSTETKRMNRQVFFMDLSFSFFEESKKRISFYFTAIVG